MGRTDDMEGQLPLLQASPSPMSIAINPRKLFRAPHPLPSDTITKITESSQNRPTAGQMSSQTVREVSFFGITLDGACKSNPLP